MEIGLQAGILLMADMVKNISVERGVKSFEGKGKM